MAKKSALHIARGVDNAPFINPNWRGSQKSRVLDSSELVQKLLDGQTTALSQAITLIESTVSEDRALAQSVVKAVLPQTGGSFRIGISGVPGVGKSTFLEAYCSYLLEHDPNAKIAILAVDPSSEITKGSILGDKTRMETIGRSARVFIRPSASNGQLGGVGKSTFEAVALCEAAGFNYVFVETVGVGQSETVVSKLVDAFLFLAMPGTGDELQGIKKGIMEMADVIALNKCDAGRETIARQSALELRSALQLSSKLRNDWEPSVLEISAIEGRGMDDVWQALDRFYRHSTLKGWFKSHRLEQKEYWFNASLGQLLMDRLTAHEHWSEQHAAFLEKIGKDELTPFEASFALIENLLG